LGRGGAGLSGGRPVVKSQAALVSFCQKAATRSVRPRASPVFAGTGAGTRSCRVGKGVGTFVPCAQDYRAPCPRVTDRSRSYANAWARRTRGFIVKQGCASAFAHPTRSLRLSSSKENRPLFRLWARGAPSFPLFRLPRKRGGRRADKAHCPDYSGRVVRITPDDEVHCDAPRALRRANAASWPLCL